MGALMRATAEELEELVGGDELWWPGLCGRVAEVGHRALLEEKGKRGWAASAIWGWIVKDEERLKEYEASMRFYVASRVHATSELVDAGPVAGEDVARDKLRYEQAFKLAGKVDKNAWGDGVSVGAGAITVQVLNLLTAPAQARVIEEVAVAGVPVEAITDMGDRI